MNTKYHKTYNRLLSKKKRKERRWKRLLDRNQCPICTIILSEENEKYHTDCPYYKKIHA